MSKKENETNQTNRIFNYRFLQFQILILKYFKMVGWIGLVGSKSNDIHIKGEDTASADTASAATATAEHVPHAEGSAR